MNYRLVFCLICLLAIVGTVSADTLIVWATTTSDGEVSHLNYSGPVYSVIRNGAGTGVDDTSTTGYVSTNAMLDGKSTLMRRVAFGFNTSSIGSGSTVTGAKLSLTIYSIEDPGNQNPNFSVTSFAPANNNALVVGDYDSFGNTVFAPYIDHDALSYGTTTPNNWTFNDYTGISKTSWTNLMLRDWWDINNVSPSVVSTTTYQIRVFMMERSTESNRPYLTITYTTGGGGSAPVASFTCTKNFLRIPNSVTCTDSSTNTPTSWSWNMGDGSAAKTTQNVTYPYLKRGIWGITLNATNAIGSNVTPSATNMKVVGYENV